MAATRCKHADQPYYMNYQQMVDSMRDAFAFELREAGVSGDDVMRALNKAARELKEQFPVLGWQGPRPQ